MRLSNIGTAAEKLIGAPRQAAYDTRLIAENRGRGVSRPGRRPAARKGRAVYGSMISFMGLSCAARRFRRGSSNRTAVSRRGWADRGSGSKRQ